MNDLQKQAHPGIALLTYAAVLPFCRRLGLLRCSRVGDEGLMQVAQVSVVAGPARRLIAHRVLPHACTLPFMCLKPPSQQVKGQTREPANLALSALLPRIRQLCRELTSLVLHDCPSISDRGLVEVGHPVWCAAV